METNIIFVFLLISQLTIVQCDFTLTVLHTNDVHSRFKSFNKFKLDCTPYDVNIKNCWGGASRRLTAVKKFRREETNTIFVDGGDQFQGTLWFTALKSAPLIEYMNLMQYDAIAFGNHEFDIGVQELATYLANISTKAVNSNIRDEGSPIKDLFVPKLIKIIDGQKIGIIGYTTPETPDLSDTGPHLKFEDEIKSLQKVANQLTQEGVNKIIAIGHSGIFMDREICQDVSGVDIVVGGHTNTFLYTGPQPSSEEPEGVYPEVYNNTGPCLVVQDYAFGKYLGKLKVTFDDNGVLTNWSGNNPVLIDTSFEPDPEMERTLEPYDRSLEQYRKTVVGMAAVSVDGSRPKCRLRECNLGNILADAAVSYYVAKTLQELEESKSKGENVTVQEQWTPAAIALWNAGGIRDYRTPPWTNITLEILYTMLPYSNTIEAVKVNGSTLRKVLEHSVSDYQTFDPHGRFLHVSGVRVVYDISRPKGSRVISLHVMCSSCQVPEFVPLNDTEIYDVVTTSYLVNGGDGYTMLRDGISESDVAQVLDMTVVIEYIKRNYPLTTGTSGRIKIMGSRSIGGTDDPVDSICPGSRSQ